MRNLPILFILTLVLMFDVSAQKRIFNNLAPYTVCGGVKADASEVYTGISLKREYAEDEVTLLGFVLKTRKDDRVFFNLESDYIKNQGRFSLENLSSAVKRGIKLKVFAYRCRRILYAYKIQKL